MVYYNGAHSMTFFKKASDTSIYNYLNDYDKYHSDGLIKHSWEDWNLIPCDGEYIAPPNIKKRIIDLPGANGSINISSSITGYPLYQNRVGSFEFYFASRNILENGEGYTWSEILSEISKFFNTYPLALILDDDRFFYYEGYFSVNSFKSDKTVSKIVIDYDLYPYKHAIISTYDNYYGNWLWDPFDFNNGYIQKNDFYSTTSVSVHNGDTISIICGDEPKIIKVNSTSGWNEAEGDITITCNNEPGKNYIIKIKDGNPFNRYVLLNDLEKNVNVEKILTFSFDDSDPSREDTFFIQIKYVGGFL